MSIAIGIDLGTTNSVAGVRKASTRILPNAEGEDLTPSCVAKTEHSFVVGQSAKDFLLQNPFNTVVSIKRLMGRRFLDPKVQKLIEEKRYAYEIIPLLEGSDNSVGIRLDNQEFTPEFISAQILMKIKADAERILSESVEYAVVTVPAYFNDKQKHTTLTAAQQAGLKVQRLLPEPTAAAIAFGVDELSPNDSQTVIVYDFGGGTFDVSILTISAGHFLEQGKTGDMWLGGDDIDRLLEDFVLQKAGITRQLIDGLTNKERHRFWGEFKHRVEQAKIDLSSKDKVYVEMLGHASELDVEVTRSEFEALITPMVERSIVLMLETLKQIDFDLNLIDQVLLVGGSSSIPLVSQKLAAVFGFEKIKPHPRPMLAVAEGAAILAHRLAHVEDSQMGDMVHTTSHDYFLKLAGGQQYLLIPSNTILPHRLEQTFQLVDPEQKLVHFQFSNRINDRFETVGDLWLSHDFNKMHQNSLGVILTFEIDENNLISVAAQFKDYPEVKIAKTLSRGQIDERLYEALEKGIERVNAKNTSLFETFSYLKTAVRIASDISKVICKKTSQVNQELVALIKRQQETNDILVEKNESPWGRLFYMEDLLENFAHYIDAQKLPLMLKTVAQLRAEIEQCESAQKIQDSLETMNALLKKHAVMASYFADIQNAIDIAEKSDPEKARLLESLAKQATDFCQIQDSAKAIETLLEAKHIASVVYFGRSEKIQKIDTGIQTLV